MRVENSQRFGMINAGRCVVTFLEENHVESREMHAPGIYARRTFGRHRDHRNSHFVAAASVAKSQIGGAQHTVSFAAPADWPNALHLCQPEQGILSDGGARLR